MKQWFSYPLLLRLNIAPRLIGFNIRLYVYVLHLKAIREPVSIGKNFADIRSLLLVEDISLDGNVCNATRNQSYFLTYMLMTSRFRVKSPIFQRHGKVLQHASIPSRLPILQLTAKIYVCIKKNTNRDYMT